MQIYLPIAEISMNIFFLLGIGGIVGFLSGMFGIGGGFMMTPLLILSGIPPAVAVASQSNQTVASSVSGAIAHWRRRNIDVKMAIFLIIGGLIGASFGLWIFHEFKKRGQIDMIISLCYVIFLGLIGLLMLIESLYAILCSKYNESPLPVIPRPDPWIYRLPLVIHFERSQLHTSIIPIITVGAGVGILTAIMGVGGGFVLIPAMIYILRIPTNICIGTSLLQILVITAFVTCAHSIMHQSVDVLLALIPMISGVACAQFGARVSLKMRSEHLRSLLALMVLGTGLRLTFDLLASPNEPFSLIIEKIRS